MPVFRFLHFAIGTAMRLWYRRLYVHFESPIPPGVPVIFACTHPNSAIDYLFAPLITRKPVFVLVRGDVFRKSWLNKLFRSVWMIPIYRIRDGFGNLSLNEQSFSECYHLFDRNGRVLIFSEGICIQKKELQPLKKGTARLALDYLNGQPGKEILIVPMANNYTSFRTFRSSVMTNFGSPIRGSEYMELYALNPNRAYQKLTDDISIQLGRLFNEIPEYSDDCLTEQALSALRLSRWEKRSAWMIMDQRPFLEERALIKALCTTTDMIQMNQLFRTLTEAKVRHLEEGILTQTETTLSRWMLGVVLAPVIVFARLAHCLPWLVGRWLVRHKIRDIIFHDSVIILGGFVVALIQAIVLTIILGLALGGQGFVLAVATVAISPLYAQLVDEFRALRHFSVDSARMGQLQKANAEARLWIGDKPID